MSLELLKDQFGCCVKLLKMISEEDKVEAIKHIKTVLMEFDLDFKDSSNSCKESVKNEYFEDHIEEEEDVKPDIPKLNSNNPMLNVEKTCRRKREISSNEASDDSPKRPSLEEINIFSNQNEGVVRQPGAEYTAAMAKLQASTHNMGEEFGMAYNSGWDHRQERNNVWGEKWRVGEHWTGISGGEEDYQYSGLGSGNQFYAGDDQQYRRHGEEVKREVQENKESLGPNQDLGSRFNEPALNQRVLDIKGKERDVFSSYDKKGIPQLTCNVCSITVSGIKTLSSHMLGKKHLQRLEDFTLI